MDVFLFFFFLAKRDEGLFISGCMYVDFGLSLRLLSSIVIFSGRLGFAGYTRRLEFIGGFEGDEGVRGR